VWSLRRGCLSARAPRGDHFSGDAGLLPAPNSFGRSDLGWPGLGVGGSEQVHRQSLEVRRRNIPGWYELNWAHVENVRGRYEPWTEPRLVVDAAEPLAANIAAAARYVTPADGGQTQID
jgi:hypothetical protein